MAPATFGATRLPERVRETLDTEGPAAALRLATGALEQAVESADAAGEVAALWLISECQLAQAQRGEALKSASKALRLARRHGDVPGQASALLAGASAAVQQDPVVALGMASEAAALFGDHGDRAGSARALLLAAEAEADPEKATVSAKSAAAIFQALGNDRGQASALHAVMAVEAKIAKRTGAGKEAAIATGRAAAGLARDAGCRKLEATIMLAAAKLDPVSHEGLQLAHEASVIFREEGLKGEAAAALHQTANALLMTKQRPLFLQALMAASSALELCKEAALKKGEAISLHTMANCHAAMRETAKAAETAYQALSAFDEIGDSYGGELARRLLEGLGEATSDVRARRRAPQASFDGLETREVVQASPEEEALKRMRIEEAYQMSQEQVLFEYAWMPVEMQNPRQFGEKFSGQRKIMMSGQLRSQSLMDKLVKSRLSKTGKATGPALPRLANTLQAHLQPSSSMQAAMLASSCTAVIYDMSNLNNLGNLEVIDCLLRIAQALLPVEERIIALDMVTASTQALHSVAGLREPFHSTVWGFGRAARLENPMHEFRNLDIDAGQREEQLPLICRWLLGAQSTRPMEVALRNGQFQWLRLVGSRAQLRLPVQVHVEKEFQR